jgi:hypothetical protein
MMPSKDGVLADLSDDKSARACLPLRRRDAAPAQAGAGRLNRHGLLPRAHCPTAFSLMGNETDGPSVGKAHQTVSKAGLVGPAVVRVLHQSRDTGVWVG